MQVEQIEHLGGRDVAVAGDLDRPHGPRGDTEDLVAVEDRERDRAEQEEDCLLYTSDAADEFR
ncbi:MAG: hypothetical protein QUU85_00900, partial [Candidatus Eisenbacteria bacterium]|nr:hypothetical protein [Candidatus Eisenbacteria bacterium]